MRKMILAAAVACVLAFPEMSYARNIFGTLAEHFFASETRHVVRDVMNHDDDDDDALEEGYKYYYGQGVAKNYAEAARWFRKSAEKGNSSAQNNLGFMYEKGLGFPCSADFRYHFSASL